MRNKKCPSCGNKFEPKRFAQQTCSPKCDRENKENKKKKKKERLKIIGVKKEISMPKKVEKLQRIFNAAIRRRDKGKPCISCGKPYSPDFQAGHYISVGSNVNLRCCEINVNGQCKECNIDKNGNPKGCKLGLIKRYGKDFEKKMQPRSYRDIDFEKECKYYESLYN